jgi:hypothetical protein
MHTLAIRTKFYFGNRVQFYSVLQRVGGIGTVFAIMVDKYGQITYMIDTTPDGEYTDSLHQGILENEMTLVVS